MGCECFYGFVSRRAAARIALVLILLGFVAGVRAAQPPTLRSFDAVVAALPHTDAAGQVVDAKDQPVSGADVFLYYERNQEGFRDRLAGKTTTDDAGRFSFKNAVVWEPTTGANPSRYAQKYDLIARHPQLGLAFTVILKGDPADAIKIKMSKPQPIGISIKDAAGKPLAGVKVFIADGNRSGQRAPGAKFEYEYIRMVSDIGLSSGVTGQDGKTTLTGLNGTDFWCVKEGYAKGFGRKTTLFKGAQLSGRVTDPEGKPAAGLPIWFHYSGSSLGHSDFTVTGADGRYTLDHLPGAGYIFSTLDPKKEADAPGNVSLTVEDVREGSKLIGKPENFQLKPGDKLTRDLKLVRGVAFAGQVLDAATGKPAAHIKLLRSTGDQGGSLQLFETDDQGRFRLLYPPGIEVSIYWENSTDGKYILDKEQANRQALRRTVTQDVTDIVLKAKLWQVGKLTGTVIDFDGKPSPYPHSIYLHSDVPAVRNDKTGHFTLNVAPRDRDFDLFVIGPNKLGGAIVHCKAGTTSVTLRTQRFHDYPCLVKTPDGLPADNLKLYVDLKLNDTTIYNVRQEPSTNAQGMFVLKGLLPTATYYAWWSAGQTQNRDYDYGNATLDLSKLKEGETIHFEAKKFINALLGKVVDVKGQPIQGAQIQVSSSEMQPQDIRFGKQYTSDRKGNFTIDRLAGGKVTIKVNHPNHKGRMVQTASDNVDCSVTLAPAGSEVVTRFRVVDENDKPVPHAPLILMTQSMGGLSRGGVTTQTLTSDAQGQLELRRPGTSGNFLQRLGGDPREQVVCDLPGYALAFGAFDPRADGEVTIKLHKASEHWRGNVTDENGKPLAGAKVEIALIRPEAQGETVQLLSSPQTTAVSGPDGKFEFPRLAKTNGLSVTVTKEGFARENDWVDKNSSNSQCAFKLTRVASLEGKVIYRATGRPAASGVIYARSRTLGGMNPANVDKDGAFTLLGMKPGDYTLQYRSNSIMENLLGGGNLLIVSNPSVTVAPGKKNKVTVELGKGIPIKVSVIDPATGKAPKERVILQVAGQDGMANNSQMLTDGTWTTYLAPGSYQFKVARMTDGSYRFSSSDTAKTIEVEAGKTYDNITLNVK